MKYILLASLLFIFYGCTSATTEKLPKIKVESSARFNGDDISSGYSTKYRDKNGKEGIQILNIGDGELEIKSIVLDKSQGEVDYKITGYTASNIKQYEILSFPHKLKKDEWMRILLEMKPTDDGLKQTTITIESNDEKNPISVIKVSASKFNPEIFVRQSSATETEINTLKVKACTPTISQGTLIDICNKGKATLLISDIKLVGDAESVSYFQLEEINFPIKMKGTEGAPNCVQKLAICHKGDLAQNLEARMEIKNNTNSDYIIDLSRK